ncbi:MAG: hypothetical protein JWN75_471, partial [Candidatus Saccharibacteria bacterium]|nr:hypothetical protein [Candidatus Saccharibacteria bacterium]
MCCLFYTYYRPLLFVQSVARSNPFGYLDTKSPVSYTFPRPMLVSTIEQR